MYIIDIYSLYIASVCIPNAGAHAGKYLFTALNWDKSIHIIDLNNLNANGSTIILNYICTCITVDENGKGIYIGTNNGLVLYGYLKDGDRHNIQDFMTLNNVSID